MVLYTVCFFFNGTSTSPKVSLLFSETRKKTPPNNFGQKTFNSNLKQTNGEKSPSYRATEAFVNTSNMSG